MYKKIKINTAHHDVLLSARRTYPVVLVDGVYLRGVVRVDFSQSTSCEDCEVVIEVGEDVSLNQFPYNNVNLLERQTIRKVNSLF